MDPCNYSLSLCCSGVMSDDEYASSVSCFVPSLVLVSFGMQLSQTTSFSPKPLQLLTRCNYYPRCNDTPPVPPL